MGRSAIRRQGCWVETGCRMIFGGRRLCIWAARRRFSFRIRSIVRSCDSGCHGSHCWNVTGWTVETGQVDFENLFNRLHPSLYRYVHRLTGDADRADDIVQESFVRLLRQQLPEQEARPWLFTVATNLVRDGARQTARRKRLLEASPVEWPGQACSQDLLEQKERIAAVRAGLEHLPPRDRQILLMREEGFKYAEIAKAVGVAPGSVGTLIARAMRKFVAQFPAEAVLLDGQAKDDESPE